jgi:hypothetical protein
MRGRAFHFAYVLTAGDRIVHFGAGAVSEPEPAAVEAYLVRAHGAELFWDDADHQFSPSSEAAASLVAAMKLEYALRCSDDETSLA